MNAMTLLDREAIAHACDRFGVARLRIFGSAVTGDFDPKRSDLDFFVDFLPEVDDLLGNYLALNEDEAMSVLRKEDSETAERVPGVHRIVGMRNVLIHGYAEINDLTVWRTATGDLNSLVAAVDALLTEAGPPMSQDDRGA